jgi:integrase
LASHDFRRSLASFLIIAARAEDGAVTGLMGHSDISVTRRLYAADWREADERNEIVLRQWPTRGSVSDPDWCPKRRSAGCATQ